MTFTPPEILQEFGVRYHRTGSTYICNPPVTDTDVDWVVHSHNWSQFHLELIADGWEPHGNDAYCNKPDVFRSFRKGRDNIILVTTRKTYRLYKLARDIATKHNLTAKADRVELFDAIILQEGGE